MTDAHDYDAALEIAGKHAAAWNAALPDRPVAPVVDEAALHAAFGAGALPDDGLDAVATIEQLAAAADPGLLAQPGPRYFGFVIGGHLPATLGADVLTSAWDQNAGLHVMSPAAAAAEDVAAQWLLDVFDLPRTASVGFVTGATMASFTCLAAARNAVLAQAGWDVEANGLIGAPAVRVLAGEEAHSSVHYVLRLLGFGTARTEIVASDDQGAMRADALHDALADARGPVIVCAQSGNVNTGALDDVAALADACASSGAWLHVDGAFGLWARAAGPELRARAAGMERAQSWAVDAHKWLNVPYDNAIAIVADPAAHRAAMGQAAAYLVASERRDGFDWTPESSRRARGFAVWAALRSLGRHGITDLVERCCALARRFAEQLAAADGVAVLNDVVLNQVLVRFGDSDEHTRAVIAAVQADGTCWVGGTVWRGRAAMRISVSNHATTEDDVDASVAAMLRCWRAVAD
ncbi:MAG TPA: aminotransferase class V-fold PLP-dependent enzyme [Mycobacteriales bacterium]|nr:aminotransferase class V-fold PLP-dependent enzyme [Mycobacteriales bacterium]